MKLSINCIILSGILFLAAACSKSSLKGQEKSPKSPQNTKQTLLQNVSASEIEDVIASFEGDKAVLVNVWATWCIPCVEEFPEIVKIQRKYTKQLQVIFVSADFPENRDKAVEFLKKHDVNWTTYFKTGKDEPFINALSDEWSGALPFSKVISTDGEVIAHWEKKADFDTFNRYVQQAIDP